MVPGAELLPEDKGHAPDQIADSGFAREEAYETGGIPPPEVAPDFGDEVRRLLEEARAQGEAVGKHVEFPRPATDKGPASEFQTRGFYFIAFPWLFPGGVGCFLMTCRSVRVFRLRNGSIA